MQRTVLKKKTNLRKVVLKWSCLRRTTRPSRSVSSTWRRFRGRMSTRSCCLATSQLVGLTSKFRLPWPTSKIKTVFRVTLQCETSDTSSLTQMALTTLHLSTIKVLTRTRASCRVSFSKSSIGRQQIKSTWTSISSTSEQSLSKQATPSSKESKVRDAPCWQKSSKGLLSSKLRLSNRQQTYPHLKRRWQRTQPKSL